MNLNSKRSHNSNKTISTDTEYYYENGKERKLHELDAHKAQLVVLHTKEVREPET